MRGKAAQSISTPALINLPWGMQGSTITPGETDSQRFIRALQKLENSAGRYSPGSLLLAQDPNDLNRSAPYPRHSHCLFIEW